MNKLLKDVAEVQMGYSFRVKLEASQHAGTTIIQMKDLLSNNTVSRTGLMKIAAIDFKKHHLVQKGDLVFRSRGQATTSAVVVHDPINTIVSAPLLRIRIVRPETVVPEYLNWYINQREAQIYFQSRAKGTVQKMISKQAVEELDIPIPSVEIQKQIIELDKLSNRERELLCELSEKREQFISGILMQYAKGASNNE